MPKKASSSAAEPTLSSGILSVILLILSIITILSFFGKASTFGVALNEWFLSPLFGSIRYFVPLFLLFFAWYLISEHKYDYKKTHWIGTFLFFLCASSLLHIWYAPEDMWSEAVQGNGGGVFGMLAWVLKTYVGMIGGVVILLGSGVVATLLLFQSATNTFVRFYRRLFSFFSRLAPKSSKQTGTIISGYDDDEEEEEQAESPRFTPKTVGKPQAENETEQDDDEEEEETERPMPTPKEPSVWQQPIIVKDVPPLSLLFTRKEKPTSGDIKSNSQVIQSTLQEFNIDVEMGEIRVGPTVTQYSLKPSRGVKLSRITALSNDLALALAAHPIRIEAPIPGKSLVGIEVPNNKTAMVSFKEVLESEEFKTRKHNMMIGLGKDVGGKVWFADLPRMPHLLIAGTTGSGKTVCMNTIIMSLLYQNTAETLRFIMVDPKRVELTLYNGIPHLLTPVITNTQKTVNALKWTIGEMDRRFELLSQAGNRDVGSYNASHPEHPLPYIVFVIDELADLMATAASEVESGIIRLAQMARAVGIHLVVATQRPSVDVITGLMKANIPARIAFSVASITDSRTILDSPGAEKLLGRGDMLFQTAELSKPVRIQGAFISEDEMKQVVEYLQGDEEPSYDTSIIEKPSNNGSTMSMFGGPSDEQDPLFEEAKNAILEAGKASASFLQRRLKVGYARAARLLDELEAAHIIGPGEGAKPREILQNTRVIEEETLDAGGELNAWDNDETEETSEEEEEQENEDDEFTEK